MSKKERKVVRSIITPADRAELERHYRFVLQADGDNNAGGAGQQKRDTTTWQERMVNQYHQHLYKEYALADLSFAHQGKIGLRWRTKNEVLLGKGSHSCGNKHCVSHDNESVKAETPKSRATAARVVAEYLKEPIPDTELAQVKRLERLPHGALQSEWEVPFTYVEDGRQKTELVKLRLCAHCAPLLFQSKGEKHPCLSAARHGASEEKVRIARDDCSSHADNKQRSKKRQRRGHDNDKEDDSCRKKRSRRKHKTRS